MCADAANLEHAVEEARRYLAISRIVGDPQRLSQFTPDNRKRLQARGNQAELTLRVAVTRLYRLLYYPDAAAPRRQAQLTRALLPAQQQGDVKRDQSQTVLATLRELGKVRTADDPGLPPAFVRTKAWPAQAERTTPLKLQREFASRIGLPILLDINLLKEAIKTGIRTGQWLYYDPRQECAYLADSPTAPLVEITDDVELILPSAAEGIPICGQCAVCEEPRGRCQCSRSPKPCPMCKHPQDRCACGKGGPTPAVGAIRAEGSAAQAFQKVVDLAHEREVTAVAQVTILAEGSGKEFVRDLGAVTLAVPQLPKAEVRVEMDAAFDLPDKSNLRVEYRGPWARFREIVNTARRVGKEATDSSGHIRLQATFPEPVEPGGREIASMRDTFVALDPGRITLTAEPGQAPR